MEVSSAKQPEILRSAQKDDIFIDSLKQNLQNIAQHMLGTRDWLQWRSYLDSLADVAYFSLTTLSARQTLGEEYTGLILVDSSRKRLPPYLTRLAMIILQCLGPIVSRRWLKWQESRLQNYANYPELTLNARLTLITFLQSMHKIIAYAQRLHLIMFYWRGGFYHMSKRLTGIHYGLVRPWFGSHTSLSGFRWLSYASLLQLTLMFSYEIYPRLKSWVQARPSGNPKDTQQSSQELRYIESKDQCSLCLDERKNSTITPCGHLYCWNCILEWLQTKSVCPLCRDPVVASRIVPLVNYP